MNLPTRIDDVDRALPAAAESLSHLVAEVNELPAALDLSAQVDAFITYIKRLVSSDEQYEGHINAMVADRIRLRRKIGGMLPAPGQGARTDLTSDAPSEVAIGKRQQRRLRQLAEVPDEAAEQAIAESLEQGDAPTIAGVMRAGEAAQAGKNIQPLTSSNSNEWYTPAEIVDRARRLMGGIDLDPASCELANETVRATYYYTEADDGLKQPWFDRVWLNPPYGTGPGGQSNQDRWSEKLLSEHAEGEVEQGVLLVNAYIDRSWFQRFWDYYVCFPYRRIAFYRADGSAKSPVHGNAIVYTGVGTERTREDADRFLDTFSDLGHCVLPAGRYLYGVIAYQAQCGVGVS